MLKDRIKSEGIGTLEGNSDINIQEEEIDLKKEFLEYIDSFIKNPPLFDEDIYNDYLEKVGKLLDDKEIKKSEENNIKTKFGR